MIQQGASPFSDQVQPTSTSPGFVSLPAYPTRGGLCVHVLQRGDLGRPEATSEDEKCHGNGSLAASLAAAVSFRIEILTVVRELCYAERVQCSVRASTFRRAASSTPLLWYCTNGYSKRE